MTLWLFQQPLYVLIKRAHGAIQKYIKGFTIGRYKDTRTLPELCQLLRLLLPELLCCLRFPVTKADFTKCIFDNQWQLLRLRIRFGKLTTPL